jgi:hypothetical protein
MICLTEAADERAPVRACIETIYIVAARGTMYVHVLRASCGLSTGNTNPPPLSAKAGSGLQMLFGRE